MPEGSIDTASAPSASPALGDIPVLDLANGGACVALRLAASRVEAIVDAGERRHGRVTLALGDRMSRWWLERAGNPYRDEVAAVAQALGRPGAFLLNMSYEWSCTAAVGHDPCGRGARLLRTLDWPLPSLGRTAVIARTAVAPGAYWAVTWPGYVGVLTGLAPGRFSASLNQPPLRVRTGLRRPDWLLERIGAVRSKALPPAHLLRRVFDTAAGYAEARRMLIETPLCLPAFFALSGVRDDETCIIERLEDRARMHEGAAAISNHWLDGHWVDGADRLMMRSYDRGNDSHGRLSMMRARMDSIDDGLDWLAPPILNPRTRLAVVANAARGFLRVQGFEADGPATRVRTLAGLTAG